MYIFSGIRKLLEMEHRKYERIMESRWLREGRAGEIEAVYTAT